MSRSIEVYSSSCYPYDEHQFSPNHAHDKVYQLFFCVEGEDHRTYGEKYVVLRKGDFLLVPKGQTHGMKRCRGTTLDIKFDVFDELLAEQLRLLSGHACNTKCAEHLILQIISLTQEKTPFSLRLIALYLETTFCVLLSNILRETKLPESEDTEDLILSDKKLSRSVMRVFPFVEHYVIDSEVPFSVDALSREAGYSEKYLYREFSRETGVSPVKYFNQIRISRAKQFLDFSDMKVSDIARILGYADTQYFVKYFKKKVGVSPSNYRKQCRQTLRDRIEQFENQ